MTVQGLVSVSMIVHTPIILNLAVYRDNRGMSILADDICINYVNYSQRPLSNRRIH